MPKHSNRVTSTRMKGEYVISVDGDPLSPEEVISHLKYFANHSADIHPLTVAIVRKYLNIEAQGGLLGNIISKKKPGRKPDNTHSFAVTLLISGFELDFDTVYVALGGNLYDEKDYFTSQNRNLTACKKMLRSEYLSMKRANEQKPLPMNNSDIQNLSKIFDDYLCMQMTIARAYIIKKISLLAENHADVQLLIDPLMSDDTKLKQAINNLKKEINFN